MKIRTGFVSNSSSSSFCILGARVKDLECDDVKVAEQLGLVEMDQKEGDKYWEDTCREALMDSSYVINSELENGYTVVGVKTSSYSNVGKLNLAKAVKELTEIADALELDEFKIGEDDINVYFWEEYD